MKLGILGGTFDPPHNGHLHIAESAQHTLHLAQVVFIPAKLPPHKLDDTITPLDMRVAMLERALKGKPTFVISMIEARRPGPSYTLDTLRELRHDLSPGAELFFIMGMDSLVQLATWHQPAEIVKLAKLAVLRREGFELDLDALEAQVPGVRHSVVMLRAPTSNISASDIRARVQAGESIEGLVPPAVRDYIEKHRLYLNRAVP
jgi:nicotinate-nucleotide adenylyltransferase